MRRSFTLRRSSKIQSTVPRAGSSTRGRKKTRSSRRTSSGAHRSRLPFPTDVNEHGFRKSVNRPLPRTSAESILHPMRTPKQVTCLIRRGAPAATDNSRIGHQPFHRRTIRRGSCFAAICPRSRIHQTRRATEPSVILKGWSGRFGRFTHLPSIRQRADSADGLRRISKTAGCVLRAQREKSDDWLQSPQGGKPSFSLG